ncbi:MAG: hypothetical protein LBN71_02615, partial [Tannerella sp.]|nr:hypothetical protein [Tannerella sp.]
MKTTELRKESMSPLSLIRAMVVTASIGCMALMMATLSGCDTEDDPGGEMDKDFPLVFSTNKLNFVDRFAQQFTLTNPGGEAVSYSAVSSEAWIELNTTSGTIAADGEAPVFVSVNTADMKAG